MGSLIVLLFVISGSAALQQDVQAKLGHEVTLHCQITTDETISVVKWSRPDLNTDGYVYFCRNKRSYENYQHPSFHGRVKLRDPEMKDGDVSLILKNVTFNDTGVYECHIAVRNPVRSKRAHTEISHFINLKVTGETDENMKLVKTGDGNTEEVVEEETRTDQMVVPAVSAAAAVVTIAGFVALWRFKRKKQQPTEADNQQLV